MSRWSKQDSMVMMKFLVGEAKTIDKKFIPYGVINIVNIEFPSDLIPGREPSELKEKARYLLNEEIQNFHTFPLEDRIWCLHVFKIYLNVKMQEEVTSSNSLHNVRISKGSLSLELEDNTPLMFYTRRADDTSPDKNMETIWSDEEEDDEVPRNDDVGSNNHRSDEIPVQDVVNPEDSPSRSESPREEDRDDIMEHVEHEVLNLPAPELEDDDERAPSISPNGQFINEAENQTDPEATTSTEREVTDSDELEDVAAPQSEMDEVDKRIAGVTRDNRNFNQIPDQDVVDLEGSPSRSGSPKEEDRDETVKHNAEHGHLPDPNFAVDDEHDSSNPPNPPIIYEAAEQLEVEATSRTERADVKNRAPERFQKLNAVERLAMFLEKHGGSAEQLADKWIELENLQADDRHHLIEWFRKIYQNSFLNNVDRSIRTRDGQPTSLHFPPNTLAPSTSAQNVMDQRPGDWTKPVSNSRKMTHNHKRVSEDITTIADLIISEYRKQSEVFKLKELFMANCIKQRFNKTYLEIHGYFPADFSEKMNDEKFVLMNKDAPMDKSLYRLRRSSIFQLDERNRLTFYSSIGRTFGAMNMEKPVQMEVSEYIIIVFLKELTRISKKQRPTDEIFEDFHNWRKKPASQKDIAHFLKCFEKIQCSVHTRRDLTTQDKQKILHIAGAPIPKDFFERCNRFHFLNQHPTGNTTESSSSGPQQRSDTQSEFRNLENSSREAYSVDVQLEHSENWKVIGDHEARDQDRYHHQLDEIPVQDATNPEDSPSRSSDETDARVIVKEVDEGGNQSTSSHNGSPEEEMGLLEKESEAKQDIAVDVTTVDHNEPSSSGAFYGISLQSSITKTSDSNQPSTSGSALRMSKTHLSTERIEASPGRTHTSNVSEKPTETRKCGDSDDLLSFALQHGGTADELTDLYMKQNNCAADDRNYLHKTFVSKLKQLVRTRNRNSETWYRSLQTSPFPDITIVAEFAIAVYRKRSEEFNLGNLINIYSTKFSTELEQTRRILNKQFELYFPPDFYLKMEDEAIVLKNTEALELDVLLRSSIFQLDERERLVFYSSIGRTAGEINVTKPVVIRLSEYTVLVFLIELTRRTKDQWSDDRILAEFQRWIQNRSPEIALSFLRYLEWIKETIAHRRDLTTFDKIDIIHLTGAPVPKNFVEWCNRFPSLYQRAFWKTLNSSYLKELQRIIAQSEPRIVDSLIETNSVDLQLEKIGASSEDLSPVEEQRGHFDEKEGEPELEYQDGFVAPVPQQEDPLNIAPTNVPTKDLAPRNLPTVAIIEEGEAPIQELVEDGPRNDNPAPNIDSESEIRSSKLIEVARSCITNDNFPRGIVMETQQLDSEPERSASYPQTPSTSTAEQHEMTNGSEQVMDVDRIPLPSGAVIDHSKDSIDACEEFQHDEDVTMDLPKEYLANQTPQPSATAVENSESGSAVSINTILPEAVQDMIMEFENGGSSTDTSLPPVVNHEVEKNLKCGTGTEAKKCNKSQFAGERSNTKSGSKIDSKKSEKPRKNQQSQKSRHVDSETGHPTDTSTLTECSSKGSEFSARNIPPSPVQQLTEDDPISSVSSEIPTSSCIIPPVAVHEETKELSNAGPSTGISSLPPVTPIGIPIQHGEDLEGEQPGGHGSNDVIVEDRNLKTDEAESNSKNSEASNKKKQIHLPKPSLKDWDVEKLRKLTKFLDQKRRVEWQNVIKKVEMAGRELDKVQLLKLLTEAQLALSKNFEKFAQPKLKKLKLLLRLRVPVGDNIKKEISTDTVYQLDHDHCIKFFCYQAVRGGEKDKEAPDNLSQLHRELLDAMVVLSKRVGFLSNEAILDSLGMDGRHGLTDKELLEELEKAKKFIASDHKPEFSDCLRVLKRTRTPVTKLLLSQAKHNFEVKKNGKNIIISYVKKIYGNGNALNLRTSKSNGGEEGSVSSTSVSDVQWSTPGLIEAPVPSPAQHSLTGLPGSNNSTTAVETLRTVTTIPVASIQVDKVPATAAAKQLMSSKEAKPYKRTVSSTGPVVQQPIVKRKRDETKEGKSAKEAKHFKRNKDKPNTTAVATVQNCSAANFPTPESKSKTSTSSTVIPDGETSKPIADAEKDYSVPMETDGFSLGVSRNSSAPEQIDVANQVAPTKATPAASDVTESSKTLNNQIQFDKVMIETNQIRPSILTGLNALEKRYALFGEEIQLFMNADVEKIKLKQIVDDVDDSLKVIKFHIEKKQSIEEKEPGGVRVVDVLRIFQTIYSVLKKYEEIYEEVKEISDKITVILKQLEKDVTGYNEMTADEVKLRMLSQAEFDDIMNFFEQQFALYPYKFLDLEKVCEEYITKHGFDKDPTEVGEKLEKVLIEKPIHLKIDPLRRMTVIYRFQIFFPTECHEEFMGYGIQVGENGRLQELHWSDTVYFGEPMRENVIAYLTELSSTSLRYRPIEELANGYEKWREANLNLETPIEVDSYLYWRIPEIVEDVMKMENLSDVLKVTLMMLTGTPITKEFRNRLNKMNKIITDEKERIVFFQEKKDTNVQLQQSYSQLGLSIQQQLPIVPAGAADSTLKDISQDQILQYLEVLRELSEIEPVPLSVHEIEAAYNRSIVEPSSRIPYLVARIPRLNEEIFNFERIPDSSRIKMLFATQTPVNNFFLEKMKTLQTPGGMNLDRFGRIIKFESNEPMYEMKLEREIMWDSNSILNPVPWGEQEIKQFFNFIDDEIRMAPSTMNLKALCVKYKNSTVTKRTVEELNEKFHRIMMIEYMENIQRLDIKTKARYMSAFGITPPAEFLRKFYKKITLQWNREQKACTYSGLIFGRKDDSRTLNRPDHQENCKSFLNEIAQRNIRNNMSLILGNTRKMDTNEKQMNANKATVKSLSISSTASEIKILKNEPRKRKRSPTSDEIAGKSYHSRPRSEPRDEHVEEKPSTLTHSGNTQDVECTHFEDSQPLHKKYDDYDYSYRGNSEKQQMEIRNLTHEGHESNNPIMNDCTGDNGLLINQNQADDQSEIVHISGDNGNRVPIHQEDVYATESNGKLLDSLNNEESKVECLQGNDEKKLISTVQTNIDVDTGGVSHQPFKSSSGFEKMEPHRKVSQQKLESMKLGTSNFEINDNRAVATKEDMTMGNDEVKTLSERTVSLKKTPISKQNPAENSSTKYSLSGVHSSVLATDIAVPVARKTNVSGTKMELIESHEKTIGTSDGNDDSTVREEIATTETNLHEEMVNERIVATVEKTSINYLNGESVSEKEISLKSCEMSQPTQYMPVPSQAPPLSNQDSVPEAETVAPIVEQQGISETKIDEDHLRSSDGTSQNMPQEEETYDRKEAMRLVFHIYDSFPHNLVMKLNAKRVKNFYDKVEGGERISMKAIIETMKRALGVIESRLTPLEPKDIPNSYMGESVLLLFNQMAKSLESSLSEEVIQQSEALQIERPTERILIGPLLGLMSSFFFRIFALPMISSN
ncbi:unnamed protein product [Caenorhabditis brenneri]